MSNAPLTFMFKDDGTVPNNPALPALVYKGAIELGGKRNPDVAIEKCLQPTAGATANGAMASIRSCIIIR